jgi:hypothetical protein
VRGVLSTNFLLEKKKKKKKSGEPVKSATACLAEIGTIQIEFTRISEITGNWKYHYVVK